MTSERTYVDYLKDILDATEKSEDLPNLEPVIRRILMEVGE